MTRRASPLLLKVIGARQGCAGVALFLRGRFFASPLVEIGAKEVRGRVVPPSYRAIDAFLQHPAWRAFPLP